MTESKSDLNASDSASRFPQSSSRRPVVRHSRDLEGAIYALLQAARIFSDADVTSTEPRLDDAELEAMAGQMIQALIFKLNRTRMFYHVQNFRQSLVFTRAGWEDTDDAWEEEDSENSLYFGGVRKDNLNCAF